MVQNVSRETVGTHAYCVNGCENESDPVDCSASPRRQQPCPDSFGNALTVAQVRCASKPGILVDGNGLMLRIQKSGAKSWVQRIIIHGKRRDIGLGAADLVSLADARETAARNRAIARNGGDPRRPPVPSFRAAEAATFEQAALDWKGGASRVRGPRRPPRARPRGPYQRMDTPSRIACSGALSGASRRPISTPASTFGPELSFTPTRNACWPPSALAPT